MTYVTAPVHVENPERFERLLLGAASDWFLDHFEGEPELVENHAYPLDARSQPILALTDPRVLRILFSAKLRKENLTDESSKAIRRPLDGRKNAQWHQYAGWRLNGFEIWSHLRGLAYALRSVKEARRSLLEALPAVDELICTGLPSVIFKPPGGRALESHHDGWNLQELHEMLLELRDDDSYHERWIGRHGLQTLLHLLSARAGGQGHTRTFAHLTPRRHLTLVTLVRPDCPHEGMPAPQLSDGKTTTFNEKWSSSNIPVFYPWFADEVVRIANTVIAFLEQQAGQSENSVVDLAERDISLSAQTRRWLQRTHRCGLLGWLIPRRATSAPRLSVICMQAGRENDGPYLVSYPRGVPHDALATAGVGRLTFTIPLQPFGVDFDRDLKDRSVERLEALSRRDKA